MPILARLKRFLDENQVSYETSAHPETYTAQEIAAALHVPGGCLAKVVMVKAGERFYMMVLPASYRIDWEKVREVLKEKEVRLATEAEFKDLFPDCEVGAMPPFGNLYNLPVYVDPSMTGCGTMVFQAGTHIDVVKMQYSDFERLVRPKVEDFAIHL